ncbi:glycosyltransferase family 2 protein [Fuscibacter oryzae]|uniref:Glycosyltransferase family 2 protein n=1 Tax=Fuscibacter oryzae TaxID=2803939 RepID=A0A8J7MS37_9RHOB|nr:glycosyltransferase family A protein [Fuscibacter oryzae]MBL4929008.1 glycosyltransferase family 2 protein [Fuscibacter oryzae]
MPGYSVIIPAFNAARTLAEAVQSACAQTPAPVEVIVVNDGSSDDTASIAAGFGGPVRLISQTNAGPGAATMTGIAAARMSVLAFLDADDLWLPGKVARQLEHLRQVGSDHLVFTQMRQFRHGLPDDGQGKVADGLSRSTLLMHRSALDRIGPIVDPVGRRGEMIDWFGRAREAGLALDVLPQVLALRRILPGSLSWGRDAQADSGYLRVVHAAMLRRRQKQAPE